MACIAFAPDGFVIAGMETGIFTLELRADGFVAAERLAAPRFRMPGMRFNDGRCDRQGRFWAGTKARVIWAYDYECDSGTPHNRRIFVDMDQYRGRPDGAAVDIDGCYWTCANDAGLVLRFTPQGVLDRKLELPVKKPSMCAFGGARLDTLFVTTIRPARIEEIASQPDAGSVFALSPGIQGVAETPFGGNA